MEKRKLVVIQNHILHWLLDYAINSLVLPFTFILFNITFDRECKEEVMFEYLKKKKKKAFHINLHIDYFFSPR